MNRNSESHFANTPTIGISRSKFDRSFNHKTTFNTGDLIPIYCDCTIMPGDTVKMRTSEIVRMMTPITPVMDNANLDIYFFFVPYRLIWTNFKRFMGENETAPWTQTVEYEIPQITSPASGWNKGSLADYFGYPTKVSASYKASALPFRSYCLVYNEWFRDQNLQNPVNTNKTLDTNTTGTNYNSSTYNPVTDTVKGAAPLKACKYHDYFTSCLPGPQKGPAVQVPLTSANLPVKLGEPTLTGKSPITAANVGKDVNIGPHTYIASGTTSPSLYFQETGTSYSVDNLSAASDDEKMYSLYAELSDASWTTVNTLRQCFAVQKFYERQALGGTRYIEMVKSHFDVTNPDYRMQRPEYLGGKRIPINMNQVLQSTPTDGTSTPLGTTGAYSVTADRDEMFTHSFTEHGILLGLAVVRTTHTYQNGLNAQFSKKKFTDFYFPEFANLGNMAVLNKEIFMGTNATTNEQAFGYQEAWATERYFPDIVTGEMRSNYTASLDIWHYADSYNSLPSLGDSWIQETKENVNRTLAVQNHDQFMGDFYFSAIYTRPMPLYSIPGLIDHH